MSLNVLMALADLGITFRLTSSWHTPRARLKTHKAYSPIKDSKSYNSTY